ncbi:hypothetical protein KKA69_00250, partial [Patescibacteria group bacterium]|nr:hypothetical protein [Patescibacteria group bacterium]
RRLLAEGKQKYSTLTRGYTYEDNVVFHLKQLVNNKFITKKDSYYSLTRLGVNKITSYDLTLLEDTGFKSFLVGFLCRYQDEYLIKSHPQAEKDFFNFPSGQPRFDEHIDKALVRIFKFNTGITITPKNFKFLSVHLKTIRSKEREAIFDDAFAIFEVEITKDQKEKMKLHEQIHWMSLEQVRNLKNCWPEINIVVIEKDKRPYMSYEFSSDYIL